MPPRLPLGVDRWRGDEQNVVDQSNAFDLSGDDAERRAGHVLEEFKSVRIHNLEVFGVDVLGAQHRQRSPAQHVDAGLTRTQRRFNIAQRARNGERA